MRTFIDFKLLLIVFVSFIFVNCDSEDVIDDIPNEAASENITGAPFGKYQQLNFEEALGYVNEIKPEKPSNEGDGLGTLNASSDFLVGVDANSLVFEDVENTAHKIPTLKARLKYPEVESTAFLIKVQDTVLGFLMNKIDDKSIDGEYFSGIIGITDLSGNFVNGYRLKNGEFISQFVISKKQKAKDSIGTTQSSRSFTTRTAPIEDRWRSGTIMLDEVVVTERRRSRYGSGSKGLSFSRGSYSFGSSAGRFSIGGGGSGASGNNTRGEGSNGNTVRIFPCDDPLHGCKNNYVDNDEEEEVPPSCKSFNFQKTTTDAYWQNAAVKNVRFRVIVLSNYGNYVNFDIKYSQPILFGVPTNMVNGGNISGGLAAELSARALSVSMREVVNKYGKQPVSETQVRLFFEQRLKYNFPIITNGGRVTFNPMSLPVAPTEYQTNHFGIGDCD